MIRKIRKIHFVGIGGIGMCGLAELLHDQGYRVTGSDLRAGATTERLSELGIQVSIGHAADQVGDADVVVYSSAVSPQNPEIEEARGRAIPVIPRAEMLAEMMRLKDGVAVAGTHGKTTTTSLVAHILGEAGLDPTAIIGGRVLTRERDATGARLGAGEILVAEADESDGSFLRLAPVSVVVTNIDADHLDHYGSFEALEQAFVDFVNRIPFWGVAVLCLDHPGIQNILPRLTRRLFTYGFTPQADLVAEEVTASEYGMRFVVRLRGELQGPVDITLPGRHNVANALAALAIAHELEVPWQTAARAIASFGGVERRFEHKGSVAGVRVVDDYGHHPAEVRATLAAAREAHRGRIVTIFQPHRYTRTRDCFDDFATAFNDADLLLVSEVYAAGEEPIPDIGGEALADAIRAHGHRNVHFVATLDEAASSLPAQLHKGDLVLTLGAGDVCNLGPRLLDALQARGGAP